MKHPLIVYVIACLWFWSTTVPLRGVPLWVLLSGESDSAPAPTPINTAVFDGSDYLRASSLTPSGLADGKTGTFSVWLNPASDGTTRRVITLSNILNFRFAITLSTGNVFVVQGWDATNTLILDIRSTSTILASSGWVHVMACWDLTNTSNRKIYINGVSDTIPTPAAYTNAIIDYVTASQTRWTIGADSSATPTQYFDGSIGELWFDDSYNDVIGDYYNAGDAVFLGSDGSVPTGSSPVLYFSSGGSGDAWNSNGGTGGALTRTGTLTTDGSPPNFAE